MLKSVKSRAEEQFAATQKKDKQALKEKEKARLERAEHVASLRALRLAKEAADKKDAEKAADEGKRPPREKSHSVCPRLTGANHHGGEAHNATRHRRTAIGIRLMSIESRWGLPSLLSGNPGRV